MKSKLFYYDLPKSLIAQKPLKKRDESKLLILYRDSGKISHGRFKDLTDYLPENTLLVINKSKVNKCRVFVSRKGMKKKVECFILRKLKDGDYLALLRPSKRISVGDTMTIGDFNIKLIEKLENGKVILSIPGDIDELFRKHGNIPLPPYIKSKNIEEDEYQTVFAQELGSTAAPTAGLHFTEELLIDLEDKGIGIAELTLHIGVDTFRPIRSESIEDHEMHSEYYSIDKENAEKIMKAKKEGKRIIAVGTTTTRVLETAYNVKGGLKEENGFTDLYIKPGYIFKVVEGMVTNFHLPMTTLLVMVSAFAGRESLLDSYEEAKREGYRFYSFGDGMLII